MTDARLNRDEISLLRDLARRAGLGGLASLAARQRSHAVGLWRRGVVEVWYRQSCDDPSLRGPFFGLSTRGCYLASMFLSPGRSRRAVQGQG